jgi:nicotinate-nucleotide--dimethylbenzimidazole phosphoribosyltransferase
MASPLKRRGTGVDDDGLARKRAAIETALHFHRGILGDPLAVAAALGGRELAAIAGAVLAARRPRVPVLLDGFVATSTVLPLARLDAGALDHCRAGYVSAESGHRDLLRELKLPPLLDLNMRLGEASGAGVAILLVAPRWPAMPEWRHSRRPASPARTLDETLPHISA